MSLSLLSEISNNYHMAVALHRELADTFWFISMPGYAMLHEYQHLDESMTQRKLKRYMTQTYHEFIPDELPRNANITIPLLGGKNRKSLKMDDMWKIIKESFSIHQEWEESALREYKRIASEILASGDVSTFNFVGEIIKDVKEELVFVTDKCIELCAHNFDMPAIVSEQTNYLERYEKIIRELLGKSKMYHRHNSALDVDARTSILDKYPD